MIKKKKKTFRKLGIEGLPQLGKEHLPKNATATIIFSVEKLEGQQEDKGVPLSSLLFNMVPKILANATRQK